MGEKCLTCECDVSDLCNVGEMRGFDYPRISPVPFRVHFTYVKCTYKQWLRSA